MIGGHAINGALRSLRLRLSCRYALPVVAAILLLVAPCAEAAELRGTVVGVSDGDTITVLDEAAGPRKVRIAGIDAPEMRQPYGARARHRLAALVLGKPVLVAWHKRDRYGRHIGHVRVATPGACGRPDCAQLEDVGLSLLESGLAWHYKRYETEQTIEERRLYSRVEQQARVKREGLWKEARPVPPWEYRSNLREAPERRAG